MQEKMPSHAELKRLLDYDPESGVLIWRFREGNNSFNARDAGTWALCTPMKNGYLCGRINRKTYYAHRIAWKWCYGTEPQFLDHINHDRTDNRIANLRAVSKQENCKNVSKGKRNTSGHVGVIWDKRRGYWVAAIKINGKNIHLGRFVDKSDAVDARKNAERRFGFHENHGAARAS